MNQDFRVLQELGEQFEQVARNDGIGDRGRGVRRHPLRRPPALAALLAALLLTSGAAAAAITLTTGSSPPVRLANGSGLCPQGYPYVADTTHKLVYPPNYPRLQPGKAADTRCFASLRDAHTDAYRLAPPPAGVTMLGPAYLGPAPAGVRRTCQTAQRIAGVVVYCPTRLPTPWLSGADPDCPSAGCSAPVLSVTGSFAAPPTYPGSSPGEGEVTIWAGTVAHLRAGVPYGCGAALPNAQARHVGRAMFRGHPAAWYLCPMGGPTMLKWQIGNRSYGITADGPPTLRRHLVRYIAAHLVALKPR